MLPVGRLNDQVQSDEGGLQARQLHQQVDRLACNTEALIKGVEPVLPRRPEALLGWNRNIRHDVRSYLTGSKLKMHKFHR